MWCSPLRSFSTVFGTVGARARRGIGRTAQFGVRRRLSLLDEAEAQRGGRRFAARADLQLAEDRGDVMVDRPRGYEQALGYLGVAQTFGHERQHLQLPRRELSGVEAGLRPGPAREAPSAPF